MASVKEKNAPNEGRRIARLRVSRLAPHQLEAPGVGSLDGLEGGPVHAAWAKTFESAPLGSLFKENLGGSFVAPLGSLLSQKKVLGGEGVGALFVVA